MRTPRSPKRPSITSKAGTREAARIDRALHPELAKRMISSDPKTGRSQFNHMGAMTLVQHTRHGGGKKTPPDQQLKEVTILNRCNNAAVVKIVASDWNRLSRSREVQSRMENH
jgi:Putative lumazine-binding